MGIDKRGIRRGKYTICPCEEYESDSLRCDYCAHTPMELVVIEWNADSIEPPLKITKTDDFPIDLAVKEDESVYDKDSITINLATKDDVTVSDRTSDLCPVDIIGKGKGGVFNDHNTRICDFDIC